MMSGMLPYRESKKRTLFPGGYMHTTHENGRSLCLLTADEQKDVTGIRDENAARHFHI
jgi:hypothetical protein